MIRSRTVPEPWTRGGRGGRATSFCDSETGVVVFDVVNGHTIGVRSRAGRALCVVDGGGGILAFSLFRSVTLFLCQHQYHLTTINSK